MKTTLNGAPFFIAEFQMAWFACFWSWFATGVAVVFLSELISRWGIQCKFLPKQELQSYRYDPTKKQAAKPIFKSPCII